MPQVEDTDCDPSWYTVDYYRSYHFTLSQVGEIWLQLFNIWKWLLGIGFLKEKNQSKKKYLWIKIHTQMGIPELTDI